ncbi:hypothetical protein HMPREF3048_10580 [Corynebacterium sp. HMSC075D04]|uniref:hypothetical protein n=1 Tax=Corynebacterium sp. HMSC075D04 TaxID=1739540 RepID=UPI0008A61E7D|nr:hypothetical protein [Corynebacterium sp. HMSC075D04]OFO33582.1 hypothetical protein HMPREF3048_10580 [Corynebacterium sp. HMSC075D04]
MSMLIANASNTTPRGWIPADDNPLLSPAAREARRRRRLATQATRTHAVDTSHINDDPAVGVRG